MKWLLPRPTDVLLDLDDLESIEVMRNRLACLKLARVQVREVKVWPSRRHFHGRVVLSEALPQLARIAIAAALGSDPRMEFKGIRDWMDGHPEPVRLRER